MPSLAGKRKQIFMIAGTALYASKSIVEYPAIKIKKDNEFENGNYKVVLSLNDSQNLTKKFTIK